MDEENVIYVSTVDSVVTRKGGPKKLDVEILATNINVFLGQVETILEKTPEEVGGKFKLTEFSISAEISAQGKLILAGTGIEGGATGGLTFKFERK